MSHHQHAGQNDNIKADNTSFRNLVKICLQMNKTISALHSQTN